MRSQASASSYSVPAKQEPSSTSAISERLVTSRRARVRRRYPRVSRGSQWSFKASSVASACSTSPASPRVFSTQVPISSSLVRRFRMASSSSRASCSGHQFTPAARMASGVDSIAARGAFTVSVAMRAARSTCTSTTP